MELCFQICKNIVDASFGIFGFSLQKANPIGLVVQNSL
jgi:hypothetical protein